MKKQLIKRIHQILWGSPRQGIPIQSIPGTYHTTMPTEQVPISRMHEVLHRAIQEVQQKLKEHK